MEVGFEEFEFGCLENGFHGGDSAVVVCVGLHHLDEIGVGIQAVDVLWDQREQVAKERETVDLELLELWWLPSV